MANKLLIINNSGLSPQTLKRAFELEFTHMLDRYFTPLPLREDFLKEEQRGAKRARSVNKVECLATPRSKRRFIQANQGISHD